MFLLVVCGVGVLYETGSGSAGPVLRTVYLPSEQVTFYCLPSSAQPVFLRNLFDGRQNYSPPEQADTLVLTVESLQRQLVEYKAFSEQKIGVRRAVATHQTFHSWAIFPSVLCTSDS